MPHDTGQIHRESIVMEKPKTFSELGRRYVENRVMSDVVTLNWHEVATASHVGWMRQIKALQSDKHNTHGYTGEGWSEHCEGACGEMAVAKYLERYWNGSVNTWKSDDLPGIQVRTRSQHDYQLIVRPRDDDQAAFVLVTGRSPSYRVRGYITGADAKRPEWLQTYGGRPAAYFVPTLNLNDIEDLRQTATCLTDHASLL